MLSFYSKDALNAVFFDRTRCWRTSSPSASRACHRANTIASTSCKSSVASELAESPAFEPLLSRFWPDVSHLKMILR